MKFVLLVALSVFTFSGAASADTTWSGGIGLRHMIRKLNDGLDTKTNLGSAGMLDASKSTNKRWEIKGNVGVLVKNEAWDLGLDLRTASSVTSEWIANTNSADLAFTVAQAFARYKQNTMGCDWTLTIGRAKTVFLYDNMAQMLFDNDVRWDGFGWTWKHGMFGFNMSQYVLGSTNNGAAASASNFSYTEASQEGGATQSHFTYLLTFQPNVTFKITDEITSLFSIGYVVWSNTGATNTVGWYNNTIHGGTAGTVGNITAVPMDNARQWVVLSDTSLPFNLRFVAEYIRNKKVFYGGRGTETGTATDHDALALSIGWKKPKKAGDFGLSYSFSNKGIGSVVNTFTNGDIPSDNRSHFFEAKYMVADALSLTTKAQFHKEKGKVGGDGQALTAPNNNRNQTQERFEFVGALAF